MPSVVWATWTYQPPGFVSLAGATTVPFGRPDVVAWTDSDSHERSAEMRRPPRWYSTEAITHRASEPGWYFVEVKMAGPGSGRYSLRFAKSR